MSTAAKAYPVSMIRRNIFKQSEITNGHPCSNALIFMLIIPTQTHHEFPNFPNLSSILSKSASNIQTRNLREKIFQISFWALFHLSTFWAQFQLLQRNAMQKKTFREIWFWKPCIPAGYEAYQTSKINTFLPSKIIKY